MDTPVKESPRTAQSTGGAIKKVGVIGAGQMGNGIAHVCALRGYDVFLMDADKGNLKKGLDTITFNLGRQVSRKMISEDEKKAALKRIASGTAMAKFKDCDLVIEAATENEQVKKEIFKKQIGRAHV